MPAGLWVALVVGGLVAGLGVVAALSFPAGREAVGGIASLTGFFLSAWALGRLTAIYGSSQTPGIALGLVLAAVVGGYSLASAMLPQAARRPPPRPITAANGDRTALLLLSDAEGELYQPAAAALELVTLQDDDVLGLGIVATPFLFAAQKARYRAIGGSSPARRQVAEIAEALERTSPGLQVDHYGVAWCDGPGNLLERVEELARDGYSRFIVQPLAVAESLEMHRAKSLVDRGRPDEADIRVIYAPPLQSAAAIAGLIARRIAVGLADPATTGIALVAHGQPESRTKLNPTFDEDESAFLNQIKMIATEDGMPASNVRLAWADWRDPDVTSTVRHLAALGCTRILVSPACYPVDGVSTLLDIPIGIKQARVEPSVAIVTLSTWRDEPDVMQALREGAVEALRELEEPSGGIA